MILLLAILAGAPSAAPPPRVEPRARAAVNIVRGRAISAERWRPADDSTQRETLHSEPDGSKSLLRLTEFQ